MKEEKTNNSFVLGDTVFIKSSLFNKNNTEYEIVYLNEDFALLYDHSKTKTYRKISLNLLTKRSKSNLYCEDIKKGDLVKCIINSFRIEEGIVLECYTNFVLVLIKRERKKLSKNNVIVING